MLQENITQFLQHLQFERNLSPHTQRNYASDLEQFKGFVLAIESRSDIPASEIDYLTIREWINSLHAAHKTASIARKLASLRTFFQFLVREGTLEFNPAKQVATPKIERRPPNHLTMEDIVRLIEIPDINTDLGRRDRAIIEFLYATGIRVGELVGINLGDIDFRDKMVRVTGKRKKQRTVPFGEPALLAVLHYIETTRSTFLNNCPITMRDPRALFLNYQGTRISSRSIGRMIDKYIKTCADIHDISPHSLRHTFATHMFDQGADLRDIQELLGHAILRTTTIYAKTSLARLIDDYDRAHPKA